MNEQIDNGLEQLAGAFFHILKNRIKFVANYNGPMDIYDFKLLIDDIVCGYVGVTPDQFSRPYAGAVISHKTVYTTLGKMFGEELIDFLKKKYAHPSYMNDEAKQKRLEEIKKLLPSKEVVI